MLHFLTPSSIAGRLKLMNIIVCGIALFFAFISFLAYDAFATEQELVNMLHTEAQILGANTVTALLYDDQQAATITLSALARSPEVLSAVVLKPDGTTFAQYVKDGEGQPPVVRPLAPLVSDALVKQHGQLLYGSRIMFKGKEVSTIYILANTGAIAQRSRHYAVISGVVLLLCMGIALLMASFSQRVLTDPLVGLAQTAQIVRDRRDYSVRAKVPSRQDELTRLVRSFNEMLGEIQERDKELETSRADLEERVKQRTADLEAFSYTVAHDLRGPLDSIENLGFLLKDTSGTALDSESKEFLDQILDSTRSMGRLVSDLLDLSRAGNVSLHREWVNVSKMAADILESLHKSDPERRVATTIAPGMRVLADDGLFCIVLGNLLGNAWKYTSKQADATIEVGITQVSGGEVFFVRDNGAGFDPAYAGRLFQPFQRLHGHTEFEGTGIGLATVHKIIQRHGGKIWAESRVGRGATFYIDMSNVSREIQSAGPNSRVANGAKTSPKAAV